jgi:hypothetical protein
MKLQYGQNSPYTTTGINGCDHGTIIKNDGEIIDMTQQAYINQGGTPTDCWYEARATSRTRRDADGDPVQYKVQWEITNSDTDDESEACNWDDFSVSEI